MRSIPELEELFHACDGEQEFWDSMTQEEARYYIDEVYKYYAQIPGMLENSHCLDYEHRRRFISDVSRKAS